jgi:hypothetical protein
MKAITIMSWPMPSYIYSSPLAKTGSTFGAISVDTAIPTLKRTAALSKTASQSRVRITISSSHHASAGR